MVLTPLSKLARPQVAIKGYVRNPLIHISPFLTCFPYRRSPSTGNPRRLLAQGDTLGFALSNVPRYATALCACPLREPNARSRLY